MNYSNQDFTCRLCTWGAVFFVFMVVSLALFGWVFDLSILQSLHPSFPKMPPATAFALIFAAISLACSGAEKIKGQWWVGKLSAVVVMLFGLIMLTECVFDWGLRNDPARVRDLIPEGISCNCSLCFVLVGDALLMLDRNTKRSIGISQGAILVVGFLCLIVFLGYIFGISAVYSFPFTMHFGPMPLPVVMALWVLVMGIFCSRPEQGLMRVIMSHSPGEAT